MKDLAHSMLQMIQKKSKLGALLIVGVLILPLGGLGLVSCSSSSPPASMH